MNKGNLSTDSYKGVRDFYPEDAAIQHYIFNNWSKTAESFGFERYDASILEPSELYKSKGAVNEEMVNEQTYTFTDRGEREVTLRPEMTPTVARLVAGKRRELRFPLRWYSIPNLFRYERPQRGRLREHWQLNCDIFGVDDFTADVEIIALAYQVLIDFGATPDMFEIRINNRKVYSQTILNIAKELNKEISEQQLIALARVTDSINKISEINYREELLKVFLSDTVMVEKINDFFRATAMKNNPYYEWAFGKNSELQALNTGLSELGINNVKLDQTLMRGFDYYTGTIFEIFDVSGENNRSLLGGGRYDNLTSLFGNEPISGIGFGMGDVTMRDFIETHKLLPTSVRAHAPKVTIIPTDNKLNLEAQKVAKIIRERDISVSVDIGTQKIGKKIANASEQGSIYTIVVGTDELATGHFVLKNLEEGTEVKDTLENLLTSLITLC